MNRGELERLTQGMADGTLSAGEVTVLEKELQSNADARAFYRRSMRVELLLPEALQMRVPEASLKTTEGKIRRMKRRTRNRMILAAAALLVLSAALVHWKSNRGNGVRVTFSPGTSWSGAVTDEGEIQYGESLQVAFGVVQFELPGDVSAVIEGPAEVRLPGPGLLELREGRGWFRVGKEGKGFRVVTPSVEVVDYGTEFGLSTRPNEADEVHVFEGFVSCAARFAMKQQEDLREGNALKVSPAGRWIKQELDAQRFITSLPPELPGIRFSFDGADALKAEGLYPAVRGMQVQTLGSQAPHLVDGVHGKALSIQGAGDIVRTDWQGIAGAAPRTIACWIRPDAEHGVRLSGIVSWGDPSLRPSGRCQLMLSKSKKTRGRVLRFALGHHLHFSGATTIVPGEWQHIAVVFRGTGNIDGDMVELYINGERELVDPEFSNPPKNDSVIRTVVDGPKSQPLQIGCGPYPRGDVSPYFGAIDEVWILPRALSAREVKGLMGEAEATTGATRPASK